MRTRLLSITLTVFTGALFGAGLVLAGMTQSAKVLGFLDVTGAWDPSLAFVMAGAIGVYAPLNRLILRRDAPVLDHVFALPTVRTIDRRLILGACMFGAGWGLSGICPGPALTALGSGARDAWAFAAAMLFGMWLFARFNRGSSTSDVQ